MFQFTIKYEWIIIIIVATQPEYVQLYRIHSAHGSLQIIKLISMWYRVLNLIPIRYTHTELRANKKVHNTYEPKGSPAQNKKKTLWQFGFGHYFDLYLLVCTEIVKITVYHLNYFAYY